MTPTEVCTSAATAGTGSNAAMSTNAAVSLYTFGCVDADKADLHHQDQLIILLTYLALNGESSRSSLAKLFWPEADNPLNSLSSALTRLRKAVPGCVMATPKTVSAAVEVDAVSLISAARDEEYAEIDQLYRGEFLHGFKLKALGISLEDWIYAQRDVFAGVALRAAIAWFESAPHLRPQAAELAERAVTTAGVSSLNDSERAVLYEMFETSSRPRAQSLLHEIAELGLDARRFVSERRPPTIPPVGELVGREFDLAVLEQAGQPGQVVHLWGPQGVGKTSLVEAAASRTSIRARFSNRVVSMTLNGQQSGTVLIERIAAALQLPLDVGEPLAHSVERYVRDAHLLLIDDVPSSRSVCDVLKSLAGGPLGVVTAGLRPMADDSIIDFGLKGLGTEALDRFDWPDAATLLYRCLDEFGLIFEDRHSPVEIAQLARKVSGRPLAIELIAAMASRLDAVSGAALKLDLDADQDPVTYLLTELWELLRADERNALESLSAFSGSFSRAVAQQVAHVDIGTLASLHRLGLIRTDEERLMRLDSTVRSFAFERATGTGQPISQPIAAAMLGLLTNSEPGSTSHGGWHVRHELGVYHHDFETAWEVAIDHRDWDSLERAVEPYVHYLLPVHAAAAFRVLLEARDVVLADPCVDAERQTMLKIALTRGAALAAFVLRQDDAASELWEQVGNAHDLPTQRSPCDALLRSRLSARAGRYQSALDALDSAVFARSASLAGFDASAIDSARLWMERGRLLRHLGQAPAAMDALRAALDLARIHGNRHMEARIYNELATTTADTDLGHALVLVDEGLRACPRANGEQVGLALLTTKASLIRKVGNLDEAVRLATHAYDTAVATNNYPVMAMTLLLKGQLDIQDDDIETGREHLSDGFRIAVRCCEPAEVIDAVVTIARLLSDRRGSTCPGAAELARVLAGHPHRRRSWSADDERPESESSRPPSVVAEVAAALALVDECA